jgi:superfamily II DNA or RNA helicase
VIRHFGSFHDRDRFEMDPRLTILLVSRPALAPALRALTKKTGQKTILIHDEVHRLGSPANRDALAGPSEAIRFRLGLSTTHEREYDASGTQFIFANKRGKNIIRRQSPEPATD